MLEGADAYKYSIGKVAGVVNINYATYTFDYASSFALFAENEEVNLNTCLTVSSNVLPYKDQLKIAYNQTSPQYYFEGLGEYD